MSIAKNNHNVNHNDSYFGGSTLLKYLEAGDEMKQQILSLVAIQRPFQSQCRQRAVVVALAIVVGFVADSAAAAPAPAIYWHSVIPML